MSNTIDKVSWRKLGVGDQFDDFAVAALTNTGVAVASTDPKQPAGLYLPLASKFSEGRVNGVQRAAEVVPTPVGDRISREDITALLAGEYIEDYDRTLKMFGPWHSSLTELVICVFDLETTGLDGKNDYITEIGAVLISASEGIFDEFSTFIDPGIPIPAQVTAITGITDAMVKGAPHEEDGMAAFLKFASAADVFAGHNAIGFDMGFVRASVARCDLEPPSVAVIDTLLLARGHGSVQALLPKGRTEGKVPNYKLGTLAEFFGIDTGTAHRATDDAKATAHVLNELLKLQYERVKCDSAL